MRLFTRTLSGLAAALSLSCGDSTGPLRGPFDITASVTLGGGLVQTIRVHNGFSWDLDADWISITSRLQNTGDTPVTFSQRGLCYLEMRDLETDIQFGSRAEPGCVESPTTVTLNPQESSNALGIVAENRSGPGRYRVRIRHATQPEYWGEVMVDIPRAEPGKGAPVGSP